MNAIQSGPGTSGPANPIPFTDFKEDVDHKANVADGPSNPSDPANLDISIPVNPVNEGELEKVKQFLRDNGIDPNLFFERFQVHLLPIKTKLIHIPLTSDRLLAQ